MAAIGRQNRPDVVGSQGEFSLAVDTAHDEQLLNATEVQAMWGISNWTLRRALVDRRLRRVRRDGYQPYYLVSDVVACFGEPRNSAPLRPVKRREDAKGGQLTFAELETAAAA